MTQRQSTSRRGLLASGAVAVVVVAALGARLVFVDDDPVKRGSYGFEAAPVEVGGVFTVGFQVEDAGGEDVEILEFDANTSPNVVVVGLMAGGPGAGGSERGAAGEFTGLPLRLPGKAGVDEGRYAAGFRMDGGVGALNGIMVKYRVGGDTRRDHWGFVGIFCTKPAKSCNPDDDPDFEDKTMAKFGLEDDYA